jgi:hypothetical protein
MKPLAVEDRDDDDDIDVVVFSYNTLCSISIYTVAIYLKDNKK